jgi:hypothetical protein
MFTVMVAERCHDVNTDREFVVNPRHNVIIDITFWSTKEGRGLHAQRNRNH